MRTLFIVLACALSSAAGAGTIYKCLDGARVSYADRPCSASASGTTLALPAAPPPDLATQERLARGRAMLQEIETTRRAEERRDAAERMRLQRAALAERKRCDRLRLQRQWAEEDLARQRGDAAAVARRKARRQAETLALECPA